MHDYIYLAILIILVTGFVVWFGGWMHKSKNEALDLRAHDEHEDFLGL